MSKHETSEQSRKSQSKSIPRRWLEEGSEHRPTPINVSGEDLFNSGGSGKARRGPATFGRSRTQSKGSPAVVQHSTRIVLGRAGSHPNRPSMNFFPVEDEEIQSLVSGIQLGVGRPHSSSSRKGSKVGGSVHDMGESGSTKVGEPDSHSPSASQSRSRSHSRSRTPSPSVSPPPPPPLGASKRSTKVGEPDSHSPSASQSRSRSRSRSRTPSPSVSPPPPPPLGASKRVMFEVDVGGSGGGGEGQKR
eukprot:CAMPEP_0113891352 /NCGR_PEP_ID=MMETSP0780_2-20120614/14705_1 /TAXON_ID=652834 /ORGANISM="Palpitomonas bilix" /LENGTH=246 /DNA_ID=CAMNT_0000880953 /DNA_START=508 /DNA_END=1245 /DNA_ORIENTATION=+ /assembly_acc=CAM_ASM_000599